MSVSAIPPRGQEFWVDLNHMKLYESAEFDQMRRLSTASCPSSSSHCYTVWKYFCRDHFGWREYSEVWPLPTLHQTLLAALPRYPLQTLRAVIWSSVRMRVSAELRKNKGTALLAWAVLL